MLRPNETGRETLGIICSDLMGMEGGSWCYDLSFTCRGKTYHKMIVNYVIYFILLSHKVHCGEIDLSEWLDKMHNHLNDIILKVF